MPQSTGNPPSNIYRIPRRFNWTFVIGGFALVTFVLMAWRLGSAAFDSHAYLDTARWLRGELPQSALQAPFSYRLAVPALAALLPGQVSHVFGVLNWLFVAATACLATAAVRRMGFGTQRALAAGMLAMLSLPVVWYAPTALVEPGSICMRMLFVFAVLTVKPRLALAAALAATAISEDNILLLGWLMATQRVGRRPGTVAVVAALAWLGMVRWWIEAGVPGTNWLPDFAAIAARFGDWKGWLSLLGCAGLVVPLAMAGLRRAPPRITELKGLLLLMLVPALLGAMFGRIDGRLAWELYPFLLPFAAAAGMPRSSERQPDVRQLRTARRA
ncbi:hypothetical protein QPK32_21050 [Massilia sp. YIM B02763]|uniref:hypothetical protein n=1 Tax=Massilia sp. YIM B02763 TaxID=3050130 RepID=UPI0025B6A973|nr:hypothetical protein [Massilia sp. YIM B02763]MDN4055561.1 hypothetical protein [Massilia sp. YIM B02763]